MAAQCLIFFTSLVLCSPFIIALRVSSPILTGVSVKVFSAVKDDPDVLEDWLTHHMEVFGPSNIYLFDDASHLPLTIQILERAARAGVTVVWSGTNHTWWPVPNLTSADARALPLGRIPTMSAWSSDIHFVERRKRCFDALGKYISRQLAASFTYIFPLDVDEFVGYLGPKLVVSPKMGNGPGEVRASYPNAAWPIQFDRQGVMDAFSECYEIDKGENGSPGYFSSHMVDARICNETLFEEGGTGIRLARIDVIDPYDTDAILHRLHGNREQACEPFYPEEDFTPDRFKKFARADNWKAYKYGGHSLETCNGAVSRWSRIVLVHYGREMAMTKAQLREKLETRFVQAGWQKKFNITSEQVHNNISDLIDPQWCKGTSKFYCQKLWMLHKGLFKFEHCPSALVSRGITVMLH